MPITYTNTNIFDSNADVLVCPVNKVGVMGKGLALEFKKRFPLTALDYFDWCNQVHVIDQILIARRELEKRLILFFPTKIDWRKPSDLALIETGLQIFRKSVIDPTFRANLEEDNIVFTSVSFPKLGCGLGQLDWESQVKPLMERYLDPLPISITIHLFP